MVGGGGTKGGGAGGGSLYIPIRHAKFSGQGIGLPGHGLQVGWDSLLMEAQARSRLESADASRQKQIAFPFPIRQALPHRGVWPPPAPLFGHQARTAIGPFRQAAGATTLTHRSASTVLVFFLVPFAHLFPRPPQGPPQQRTRTHHFSTSRRVQSTRRACLSPPDGPQRLKTHVVRNTRPENGFRHPFHLVGPHTRPGSLSKCSRHCSHALPTLQGAAARGTASP